jgi:hypothetical protein
MSAHPPLLPLRHVEGFLITDVTLERLSPLLHQAVVMLTDELPSLRLVVAVLVDDEDRREGEELHVREVLVAT